jgi:hypothetical protein
VSLERFSVRLLITSRGIQQPSGPSHDTHNLTSPLYFPLSSISYSGRVSSSELHTETRLGKRASYHIHLSPAPQGTHTDDSFAPVIIEYVPAQHRHASVDRHEPARVAVLHHLPSAARRHARMLHLSSAPPFDAHSLVAQQDTSRGIQQPSGPLHHTTQSHKPPILPAVYIYSGRASSSALRTETRLGKRA